MGIVAGPPPKKFCIQCGAPLTSPAFCTQCGARITASGPPEEPAGVAAPNEATVPTPPVSEPRPVAPEPEARSSRKRWLIVVGVVVALVVLGGVGVFVVRHRGGGGDKAAGGTATSVPQNTPEFDLDRAASAATAAGLDDPRNGDLPPVDQQDQTVAYLKGDGAKLVTFSRWSVALLGDGGLTTESCTETAKAMDALGTPDDLYAAAGSIPDTESQGMFVNVVASSVRVLSTCGTTTPPPTGELGFNLAVVQRRLQQLGLA